MPTDLGAGYTVRDLARRYRVSVSRVLSWIRTRELRAIDRRDSRSSRPAFVIVPEALAEFERRREAAVAPPPKTPQRKKRTTEIDFFSDL